MGNLFAVGLEMDVNLGNVSGKRDHTEGISFVCWDYYFVWGVVQMALEFLDLAGNVVKLRVFAVVPGHVHDFFFQFIEECF